MFLGLLNIFLPADVHCGEAQRRHIIARSDYGYPPYEFLDAAGKPVGYNVELIKAIAEVMGLTVEIRLGPWAEVRKEIEEGRIDMLLGMYYSPERDKLVDFSHPHTIVNHAIFVRKGSTINSVKDLPDKQVIVQQGDIMHDYARHNRISPHLVLADTQLAALRLLASGKGEAALLAEAQGLYHAREYGLTNVTTAGPPFQPREYCFAVREGDKELQNILNQGIDILKSTGRYEKIYNRWLGSEKHTSLDRFILPVAVVLAVLLLIMAAALLWSWSLRRQVRHKTQELHDELVQRQRSEQELRESQRRLADIIEFLPDATMVVDKDGKVIAWNRAIEIMTGIKAAEMLGKGNHEYTLPFYGERRPILIDLALYPDPEMERRYTAIQREGDILFGEAYIPDLCGRTVYLFGTASPLYDTKGAIVGAIETIRDITARRQMEIALASEHDRLAAILDGIPIPAFMIDRNRTVVLWNRNNEIFTGVSKDEMLNKELDLSFLYQGKTSPTLAELVLEMMDDELMRKYGSRGIFKSDIFPGAFESVGKIFLNGEERIMSIQAARIYNPQGDIIGAVQTARDITEGIRLQKEQEKLQSQLIQAQKLEAIGTLAGGIAHDFNNILAGIMGYSELCLKEVQDRPKVYNRMEQVLKAAERAKDLVQQILTFSRRAEHRKKPTALSPIIKEVINFMRASLPTIIEIRQKIEETSDVIMADPTQLHQVLINLCTNAGHAMKETGGILEIGLEEIVISPDDLLPHPPIGHGHYLVLTVRDTGRGIVQENLGRIFEPYFTTKEQGEGTGLGLAVVHGIVKAHGGEIRVYSEVGKGTIFRVYLPLIEKEAENVKNREEDLVPGKGENILFIDDEKMVVDLSKELLEELGYLVVTETDPVKAIESFKRGSDAFDLVITDKTMPHLTGFDVAWEIRRTNKDVPIILCSGLLEKEDLEKLTALGISRMITKPIRMSALAKVIREVLDK